LLFNGSLAMAESYYAVTASPSPRHPVLAGNIKADLIVIGGGCTGLSTALFAAKHGLRVVLLEGGKLGWGASGRNGGQIIPGLRQGPQELVERYGSAEAKRLFTLAISARDLVTGLIEAHGIACDLALTGHLYAARRADLDGFRREAEFAAREMDYPHLVALDRRDLAEEVATDHYDGGLLDRQGGHFHPLNYTLGLARAAEAAGVAIYQETPVITLTYKDNVTARTALGSVTAPLGVLACDALLGRLDPGLAGRIMPIASHVVTTAPLRPDQVPIPRNRAISDSYFSVNYYRMTADNRLLFGGGERYFPRKTNYIETIVRAPLEKIFPQLKGVVIDHAWGGLVSITTSRLPDIGRKGALLYAQGYSGQGAILSTLAGRLMADAAAGTAGEFDVMSKIKPAAFPGGTALRTPLHVLGMAWYGLRDRLGGAA
jgi:gamma-glutamylputrescine oxidase